MIRRNLVLTLVFAASLGATAGCANMSSVRTYGGPAAPQSRIEVAPNDSCKGVRDTLEQRLQDINATAPESLVLEVSCATRPISMTFDDVSSDEIRKIKRQGWPFISEARALVYDANGNVVSSVWAGIGHRRKLTAADRSLADAKLGEAIVGRLSINDREE